VQKSFGGVRALAGVDLSVADNRIVGVIGANGAGKTTLFDICSGFVQPEAGRVLLDGRDVTHLAPAARAAGGLGRSFQDARLFASMTVLEAIATALERHVEVKEPLACTTRVPAARASERRVARRADELLEEMGLTRYRDSFVSELSTGTRRILDLACALAHQPRVLLLDEPSAGIAHVEGEALVELLLEVRSRSGASLVVVEHDMGFVSAVADELVCLDLGVVIARGAPAAVLSEPAVVHAYLGESPDMVTTAEYARMTGRSVGSILRRIRAGELDAVRNGRGYRIPIAT
jgi:branched-chain amino acid transport system ATP-binding protein